MTITDTTGVEMEKRYRIFGSERLFRNELKRIAPELTEIPKPEEGKYTVKLGYLTKLEVFPTNMYKIKVKNTTIEVGVVA